MFYGPTSGSAEPWQLIPPTETYPMSTTYQDQPMPNPMRHNYVARLMGLLESGKLPWGQVSELDVQHDDWCQIDAGGYCNCLPNIYLDGEKL